jgi:hypothetical protein
VEAEGEAGVVGHRVRIVSRTVVLIRCGTLGAYAVPQTRRTE